MRILLAIDGSKQSIEAAYLLSRLPLPQPCEITVGSVLLEEHFALVSSQMQLKRREAARKAIKESFETVETILKSQGINAQTELITGHPKRHILKMAEDIDADLIVLGDHGHSALARALLGSTSDYVVNHARCSVLMVRPTLRTDGDGDFPFKVLLAYDGSAGSKTAASQLFAFNWNADTEIRVAMLLERPTLIPDDIIYDEPAMEEAERETNALLSGKECARCQANVEYVVRETVHIGSGLTHMEREEPRDIMWVGGTGRSEISKFFLGCVSRHVLHHANCSVWIAREKCWKEPNVR